MTKANNKRQSCSVSLSSLFVTAVLRSSHISLYASLPYLHHPSLHSSTGVALSCFSHREPYTHTHAHTRRWETCNWCLRSARGHCNLFTPSLISELVTWWVTVEEVWTEVHILVPHPHSTRVLSLGNHWTSLDDFYIWDEIKVSLLSSCTLRRIQGF